MQNDVLWGIAAGALTAGGLSAFAVWHDEQALCNGDPVLVCQGGGGQLRDTASAGLEGAGMVIVLAVGLCGLVASAVLAGKGAGGYGASHVRQAHNGRGEQGHKPHSGPWDHPPHLPRSLRSLVQTGPLR